ncbi:hypothetical protein GALMADRAFT_144127 [Galerina marginata CBS 339.88]|uniref:Uncharacterized protein n=1 Tax=Galerina marginata (strain CBS 339.88) TaxID=685588 RepID=A0A067SLZ9_GALM3|nr:hypothetical protein GALMADRAFT_144127 [Galerina marginata CBS 339.88]
MLLDMYLLLLHPLEFLPRRFYVLTWFIISLSFFFYAAGALDFQPELCTPALTHAHIESSLQHLFDVLSVFVAPEAPFMTRSSPSSAAGSNICGSVADYSWAKRKFSKNTPLALAAMENSDSDRSWYHDVLVVERMKWPEGTD